MEQRTDPTTKICKRCGMIPHAPGLRKSPEVVAESALMQEVLRRAARFAHSDAPVVVSGETGTGKEIVARVIHANSERSENPFVAINVAALPAELLESELFGHGKGAFTGASKARQGLFEEAHKGTLFLDEIGEMPLPLQAKLLRALQDGEVRRIGENKPFVVDVRIICATHRNLAKLVQQGLFRQDLYYRLKVLSINVPPLRQRKDDILTLACHFFHEEGPTVRGFSSRAEALLLKYPWPGNIRELQNAVRHGVALSDNDIVDIADLPDDIIHSENSSYPIATDGEVPALLSLADLEKQHILRVLEYCDNSQTEAAKILGIARNTLWRKLNLFSASKP